MREESENKFFSSYKNTIDSKFIVDKKNSNNMQQHEFTCQVSSSNDVPLSEKRNGSVAEVTPSTSEKGVGTSKVKTQSVKLGKTQSGPLMPGTVLGPSLPERGHAFERYIVFSYYIFIVVLILGYYWKFEMEWKKESEGREVIGSNCLSSVW